MKPLLLALLASALLTAGITACGSASPSAPATSASGVATSPAVPAAPTATTDPSTVTTATTDTTPVPSTGGGRTGSSSGGDTARSPSSPSQRFPRGDDSIQTYGKAAGESDKQAVTVAVKRYYAALAAGDDAAACVLLSSNLSRTLLQGFGRSPSLRGKGCAGILSVLIDRRAAASLGAVEVTGVRVKQDRGFALLRAAQMPSGEIPVQRDGGAWKMGGVIGSQIP